MSVREGLPFKVGQLVESRSFQEGFRGAWFRSKISTISKKRGQLGFRLEYLDFPDEENTWTQAYEKSQSKHQTKYELMVRPSFPPIFRKSQMADVKTISEVVVEVNDAWKVGDLIDWWKDGCYWSGSITEIAEDENFKIVLLPPPLGEGLAYEACSKDLRPSLHWSIKHGWTVPTPKDSSNGGCARIVKPIKKGKVPAARNLGKQRRDAEDTVGASRLLFSSSQPRDRSESIERSTSRSTPRNKTHAPEGNAILETDMARTTSCLDSGSSSHVKSKSNKGTETDEETEERHDRSVAQDTAASLDSPSRVSSGSSLPLVPTEEKESREQELSGSPGKASCLVVGDSRPCEGGSAKDGKTLSERDRLGLGLDHDWPAKKIRFDGTMPLNSMLSNMTEASILDLEELLHRVKWMKGMLENGKASSDSTRPPWKFLEHRASSTPR